MKARTIAWAVLLGLASPVLRADLPRTAVTRVPQVLGRDIERLVLLTPIVVDRSKPGVPFANTIMVRIVPGTFIPVSDDPEGIYYQAVNGFLSIRSNNVIDGGLYVSKSRPG
ncbi:MAG: hypothetical protein ABR589_03580 [Chthoniobacterales bacterium]